MLGGLLFFCLHRQIPVAIPAPPAVAKVESPSRPAIRPTPEIVGPKAAPFRWSQLVSTNDYRVFVANLRASGCPEPTVEDIVRGDAERVFSMMRQQLGVDGTEPGPWSGQSQSYLVAYLLGQTPTAPRESVANAGNNEQTAPATMAAFLQTVDATPGMTDEQAQETAALRQGFLAQLSGLNQLQQYSAAGAASTEPSPAGADSALLPQIGTDNTDGTQPSQSGTDSTTPQRTQMPQSLLQATAAESILGGMFGVGAAAEYDQYQATQGGQ